MLSVLFESGAIGLTHTEAVTAGGLKHDPLSLPNDDSCSQGFQSCHFGFDRVRFDVEVHARRVIHTLKHDLQITGRRLELNEWAVLFQISGQRTAERGAPKQRIFCQVLG